MQELFHVDEDSINQAIREVNVRIRMVAAAVLNFTVQRDMQSWQQRVDVHFAAKRATPRCFGSPVRTSCQRTTRGGEERRWTTSGRDPTIRGQSAGVPLPTEPRAEGDGGQGGVPGSRRVHLRKNNEIRKDCETPGCQGCLAVATENNRSISHNDEYRKRVESATRGDAVGAELLGRIQETGR